MNTNPKQILSGIHSSGDHFTAGRRFWMTSLLVWPVLGIYMVIDRLHFISPIPVVMPSWVPFWPAFAVLYLMMLLMTWLLPVVIHDAGLFRACLVGMACGYLLVLPIWICVPTSIARPPMPDGWWVAPYRLIVALDPPCNVLPCAHGIGPMVAAWFTGRDRPNWRRPLAAALVLSLPTIALIGQHRPVDILLGIVPAVVGIAVGEALNRLDCAAASAD
jgi:hypothetical protein